MNSNVRTFGWVLIALLVAALTVTMLTATIVGADNTNIIRQAQRDNAETLRLIRSCTTPGQECFDRGQERTANVVADINRVAVFAAACADKPRRQTVQQIQSCVIARLAAEDRP
jgi:hypothetical protein